VATSSELRCCAVDPLPVFEVIPMLNVSIAGCCSLGPSSLVQHRPDENRKALRSVLYVDDDWEHLASQCALLENAGYRVEATDSPAAGLSSYVRTRFDAVILDFHLPFVSNGLLATVMRRFRSDVPFILIGDRSEFAGTEGTLNTPVPSDTTRIVTVRNLCDLIERGHDLYEIVERGPENSADAVQEIVGWRGREDRM
jgi:CheY-like chemotaxis protein